ncbi:unnamed protein product [Cuscuta campestris]|uniref:Uncharacterized protein n=1 Tax=Cuscuta campestris TaxID=132261 RepID=A0A484MUN6_9ASTE|nr:unnamed protein product [Cuscuta campestris]
MTIHPLSKITPSSECWRIMVRVVRLLYTLPAYNDGRTINSIEMVFMDEHIYMLDACCSINHVRRCGNILRTCWEETYNRVYHIFSKLMLVVHTALSLILPIMSFDICFDERTISQFKERNSTFFLA